MPACSGRSARAEARENGRTAYLAHDHLVRSTKARARQLERIMIRSPHIFFGIDKDLFDLAMITGTPYDTLLDAARKCAKTTITSVPCVHSSVENDTSDARCEWHDVQLLEPNNPCRARWTRTDGRVLLKTWLYSRYNPPNFVYNPCWDTDGAVWVTPVTMTKKPPDEFVRAAIIALSALSDKRVTAVSGGDDDGAGSSAGARVVEGAAAATHG